MALASLPGSFTLNGQRFTVWSGNPAFAKDSADGATFWAVNAKRASDKAMYFLVIRQDASGALTLAHQSEPTPVGAGQGTLRVEAGRLVASYFIESGDAKATRQVVISGYVAAAPGDAPGQVVVPEPAIDLAALPVLNNHQDYRSNEDVLGGADRGANLLELIQRGWLYIRINRIRQMLELITAAVEQLQRLERQRGGLQ
ncbi:MAG TPA: hypothetical protein PKK15_05930 [Kouleothrix sp.]|nr:hypothetical protein [Kouleothrix sp.]